MNTSKVWGKNTRECIKHLDAKVNKLEKLVKTNHTETKELMNDTNLNFMDNEKNIEEQIMKINARIDGLEEAIHQLILNQMNNV